MKIYKNYLILFLQLFLFIFAKSTNANDFETWKLSIIKQAVEAGISEKVIKNNLKDIKGANKKVLKYYKNQPEFKISLEDYINRNINKKRISKGKVLLEKHKNILSSVSKTYEVPSQIIIAIWALESNFGYYTGSFNIIDALTTLSYDSKRKSFFKKELFSALKILDKNLIEKDLLTGSWAGAMGQSQFMPSSYLSYAVDFNKDKKIDIWKTEADVFASIANYLNKHGWEKDQLWSLEIKKRKDDIFNKDKIYNIDEIKKYIAYNKKIISNTEKSFAKIKEISDHKEKNLFFVFDNFKIIKKYNNSDYYALTVGKLANLLLQ